MEFILVIKTVAGQPTHGDTLFPLTRGDLPLGITLGICKIGVSQKS